MLIDSQYRVDYSTVDYQKVHFIIRNSLEKKLIPKLNEATAQINNHKTLWESPCVFHFVEIQSEFCLYLQNGLEFSNQTLTI